MPDSEFRKVADVVHVDSWILGAQLLDPFQPGQSTEGEHIRNAHQAVYVVNGCRSLVDNLLSVAKDVIAPEILLARVRLGPEQL